MEVREPVVWLSMSWLHILSILLNGAVMGFFFDVFGMPKFRQPVWKMCLIGISGSALGDVALLGMANWFVAFYSFYTPIFLPFIHFISGFLFMGVYAKVKDF